MISLTPGPSREVTFTSSSRLLGVANVVLTMTCAIVLAIGLSHLAERRFASGVWLLIAVLLVRWGLTTMIDRWRAYTRATLRARWRSSVVQHFVRRQPERERGRGDLALAIEQASDGPMMDVLETSALTALGGLGVLFWAGGWLSFVTTVALLGGAVPLYRRAGQRSEATALEYQRRRAVLESRQLEILLHTTELRALGAVDYGANEIAAISDSEHTLAIRAIRVALESSLVTEFLSGVSIGLVAMVVGFALLDGRISLEHALIAVLVTSEIFAHVRRFGVEFHRREDSERSLGFLDARPLAVNESTTSLLVVTELVTDANEDRISFAMRPGESLVITGRSGVGKTTLLDTLVGWREPVSGTVQRSSGRTGHVSMESSLVSGSLRDNLTLGQPISDVDVLSVLADLGLSGPRFEDLDTTLLPDGKGISAGEKVRLSLARALLARPALMVIDDVAGVLDQVSRRRVRDVLDDHPQIAIVEATVDTPLTANPTYRIDLT